MKHSNKNDMYAAFLHGLSLFVWVGAGYLLTSFRGGGGTLHGWVGPLVVACSAFSVIGLIRGYRLPGVLGVFAYGERVTRARALAFAWLCASLQGVFAIVGHLGLEVAAGTGRALPEVYGAFVCFFAGGAIGMAAVAVAVAVLPGRVK
jgi:hypothetical protein